MKDEHVAMISDAKKNRKLTGNVLKLVKERKI
jgi:hypothetical protein